MLGDTAVVLESNNVWRRVRLDRDAYEGWLHRGYLREWTRRESDAWNERARAWSEGAELDIGGRRVKTRLSVPGEALPSAPRSP